ncbi:cache domain-containing sensor histidine kinase [Pseudobutyrivibrio ruminis]|uniref:Two-component system, sensor histidine kinase YesM n=1 Tax=Pseudobutyrivibrio ruminis DSM 9787 TaxID=1123011 RepID=A0A285SUH2_9FIRM|nr:sensor histidine kinase [Pseudobutyrivibrio ruminis]SOC11947.1 two-component system, sensor histidine kinase YesM [Pseudobutyrivibrio ruminis DSM 9787]
MRNIIKKYNNLKIGQKLISIFLLISIIPIILLQVYQFTSVRKTMTSQVDEIIYDDLVQISERTNLSIENYTNLLYQIYVDEDLIDEVMVLMNGTESRKAAARSDIREKLHRYTSVVEGIRAISLVCKNGESVTYDFETDSSMFNIWQKFNDMRIAPPYLDAESKSGMVITPSMKFAENSGTSYYFHISKRMFNFDMLEKGSIATVIMTVDEDVLDSICNSSEANTNGINFIVDTNGRVVSYPDEKYIATQVGDDIKAFVKNSGYLSETHTLGVNEYIDESTGWTFINVYDADKMLKDVRKTELITIIISISVILVVILIIIYTTKTFNNSVNTIVEGMQTVQEGDLDKRINIHSTDEFGIIANNFNVMTERVKELMHQISSAKDRQRHAELKALEAQINPHFLYNTLDTINWMAIEHHENEISKALSNLGLILRHSISKVEDKTPLKQECDFLTRYLDLQELRYEGSFKYELIIDPEVKNIVIHKLLIQPFVENAIIHGFEGIEEGGLLSINIDLSYDKKYLQISIADNGNGFEEDLLVKMNDRQFVIETDDIEGVGLGLRNAFSRLVMYYGDLAHWNINSVEEIGTEITLYIPMSECC